MSNYDRDEAYRQQDATEALIRMRDPDKAIHKRQTDISAATLQLIIDAIEGERQRCVNIARAHKGSYAKRPNYKAIMRSASEEARQEIYAEQRGEDIAAELIALEIRKVPS